MKNSKKIIEENGERVTPGSKFYIYDGKIWEPIIRIKYTSDGHIRDLRCRIIGYKEVKSWDRQSMIIKKYNKYRNQKPTVSKVAGKLMLVGDTVDKVSRYELMDLE